MFIFPSVVFPGAAFEIAIGAFVQEVAEGNGGF